MESANLGVTVGDGFDSLAPPRAQLLAYRAAEWGGFGFGVAGSFFSSFSLTPSYTCGLSATLLCFFLRGVGIVGNQNKEDEGQDTQPSSSATLKSRDSEEGKAVSPSSTPPTI